MLWVDCDGEHAVDALRAFDPAAVDRDRVAAAATTATPTGRSPSRSRATRSSARNRRLAHALGADPASADAARILRVPGTCSHKHQPPTPVEALRLDVERRLAAGRRRRRRSPTRRAPPCQRLGRRRRDRGDDPLLAIPPEVYVAPAARRRRPAPSQGPLPVPRRPACKPARLRHRGARLVLLRRAAGAAARSTTSPHRSTATTARGEDFLRLRERAAPPVRTGRRVMATSPRPTTSSTSRPTSREGMTIREWRAQRAAERATAREAERAATRARSRARLRRPTRTGSRDRNRHGRAARDPPHRGLASSHVTVDRQHAALIALLRRAKPRRATELLEHHATPLQALEQLLGGGQLSLGTEP